MKNRVKNIFNNLEKNLDFILLKNSAEPFIDYNFFYATGIDKGIFEGSIAILHPDGKVDLIVSELEADLAKKADLKINVYKTKEDYDKILNEYLCSVKTIGINNSGILHRDFCKLKERSPQLNFIDVSEVFVKTRSIKDNLEIKLIKESCRIVDKVIENIPGQLKEGMYEYELAAEIDYLMQKYGADKPAFETISSFGKNTAYPHYTHGDSQLVEGSFVLCDFGACLNRYNSDITRTYVFGRADKKSKEMYETVLEAQKIAFEKIIPGIQANEVHNAVSYYIENTKFKGCFIHSTGHSLGLSVHDIGPGFGPESNIKLEENMVFTVEPGVYIPGFGGVRIEDNIVIKKDGIEILSKSPKKLIEI